MIEAGNNGKDNVYIQSATLNAKTYSHNWLSYHDIVKGGTLHLEMGDKPALNKGLGEEDKPFSVTK